MGLRSRSSTVTPFKKCYKVVEQRVIERQYAVGEGMRGHERVGEGGRG